MRVGLIGGTGVDEIDSFTAGDTSTVVTAWGSAEAREARVADRDVVFVPRHGIHHTVPPAQINCRAQIAALKKLGAEAVISICAVGSLRTELAPGSLAVLSDFIDLTKNRTDTFFDSPHGPAIHTDLTEPYCPSVSAVLRDACSASGAAFEPCATYVGVDGPRYESPAEIRLFASWGGHVVGMTNLPEVVLAREAGLCYGTLAVVTNLACGLSPTRLDHDHVRSAMAEATENLHVVLGYAIGALSDARNCSCGQGCRLSM